MAELFTITSSLREYPIIFGNKVLDGLFDYIRADLRRKKVYIVVDEYVLAQSSFIKSLISLQADLDIHYLTLPQGEATKSLKHIDSVYEWLLKNSADRNSVICAIGGGVIGDAVGFVASSYMRGITFIQVPTSLLSMVDSSVGGKVGINHALGKNMIGAFYPPHAVFIDLQFLQTLPKREYAAGLAECVKHGLIFSEDLFSWYNKNSNEILTQDPVVLPELISRNLRVKAHFVEKDEKEQNIRAFLNFGHTFAHAIEKAFNYTGEILHGEAVSLGMCAALFLSQRKYNISQSIIDETLYVLRTFNLPTSYRLPEFEVLLSGMKVDKKNENGSIRFVLLKTIGEPVLTNDITIEELEDVYKQIKQ